MKNIFLKNVTEKKEEPKSTALMKIRLIKFKNHFKLSLIQKLFTQSTQQQFYRREKKAGCGVKKLIQYYNKKREKNKRRSAN